MPKDVRDDVLVENEAGMVALSEVTRKWQGAKMHRTCFWWILQSVLHGASGTQIVSPPPWVAHADCQLRTLGVEGWCVEGLESRVDEREILVESGAVRVEVGM
jgi:hypothetical protein